MRSLAALLAALLLHACAPPPDPAQPALWEVSQPGGGKAWLMGTVHALERAADWHGPQVAAAMAEADLIVTELGPDEDAAANAQVMAELSQSKGLPPLSQRVVPEDRPALAALLRRMGQSEASFAKTETWAAALALAQGTAPPGGSENGIDRAVLAKRGAKPVEALEGAAMQLAVFDRLPESEQRDLLALTLRDIGKAAEERKRLAEAWRRGDMVAIDHATREGLLADPELREALYTARNRAWTARIAELIGQRRRIFVAVGAAHMAGDEGLPVLLADRGLTVRRVQ